MYNYLNIFLHSRTFSNIRSREDRQERGEGDLNGYPQKPRFLAFSGTLNENRGICRPTRQNPVRANGNETGGENENGESPDSPPPM